MNEIGHGRTPQAGRRPAEKKAGATAPKRAGTDLLTIIGTIEDSGDHLS
jgi:hypothetical protein